MKSTHSNHTVGGETRVENAPTRERLTEPIQRAESSPSRSLDGTVTILHGRRIQAWLRNHPRLPDRAVGQKARAADNGKVKQARPPLVQVPKGRTGGRSGLHRAA